MSGSRMWRFSNGSDDGKFRFNPMDSLMEAKSNSWMLQWQDETGDNVGEVMCGPLLTEFADECAHQASHTTDLLNADWARHWAQSTYDKEVMGALGAARHCALAIGDGGEAWVAGLLHGMCDRARGSLR